MNKKSKTSFSSDEIAEYYDRTEVHYRRAWDLNTSLAMHYGYWDEQVRTFRESLNRMNEKIAEEVGVQTGMHILDAGCGVGGSSIFLAKRFGAKVTGVTLSEKQVLSCKRNAALAGVLDLTNFYCEDFTKTSFPDESFDIIWGAESVVYITDKLAFFKEAKRLLKPNGRLILAEYVLSRPPETNREEKYLSKWLQAWAMDGIVPLADYEQASAVIGMPCIQNRNITDHIRKSSWRMYYGSHYLAVLSNLYRLINPKVNRFADKHYESLYYQYKALKSGLWEYYFLTFSKSEKNEKKIP